MTNSKNTKRALVSSALAILMCVAMLIGTTFAWFTDSASTTVNKIQAGNLNIALYYKDADGTWQNAENKKLGWTRKTAFDGTVTEIVDTEGLPLWEPGCTFSLPELKIVNEGNLALKYKIVISGITGSAKLNEVIDWTMNLDGISETLGTEHNLAAKDKGTTVNDKEDIFTISGKMETTAGNEYQGLSIDGIGITVYATQLTSEFDSNGNQYDALAQYPIFAVEDAAIDAESKKTTTVTEIKSGEVVSASNETPLATAKVPTGAKTTSNDNATSIPLTLSIKNVETTKANFTVDIDEKQAANTLEIKVEGLADDNQAPVIVTMYVGTNLNNFKLYHKGVEMKAENSAEEVTGINEDEYFYNKNTGIVTMATKTFSPFTYLYNKPLDVSNFEQFITALDNAEAGDTIKLTGTINPTKNFTFNKSIIIDMNGHGFVRGAEESGGYLIDVNQNCDLTMKNGTWTIDANAGFGKITVEQADSYSDYTENSINNIVFENVNFINNKPVTTGGNSSNGIEDVVKVSMCWGMTVNAKFTNCTFKNAKITFSAMSKNNNNTFNATFEGCKFDNLGNTSSIHDDCIKSYISENCSITVKNCEFNIASTSGVYVVGGRNKAVALTFIGNTVNGSLADSSQYTVTSWANLNVYNSDFKSVIYKDNTLTGITKEK